MERFTYLAVVNILLINDDKFPANMIPKTKWGIEQSLAGVTFSEFDWK